MATRTPTGAGMTYKPPWWFDRQLEHVRRALAEADKQHTEQELADAAAFLGRGRAEPQKGLFEVQ